KPSIIDADDRHTLLRYAGHQSLLDRCVMRECSVAVEMVLGDVEKNADRGVERRREVDLIRGALDHMRARLVWRGQREDGSADVTADLRVAAGRAQQMRNERGGRRLAVGASDGDERCCRRTDPALAAKQ